MKRLALLLSLLLLLTLVAIVYCNPVNGERTGGKVFVPIIP